eukprot:SM000228S07382  [mRNA]  locus=s228:122587:124707:+ [translate_table: standard]
MGGGYSGVVEVDGNVADVALEDRPVVAGNILLLQCSHTGRVDVHGDPALEEGPLDGSSRAATWRADALSYLAAPETALKAAVALAVLLEDGCRAWQEALLADLGDASRLPELAELCLLALALRSGGGRTSDSKGEVFSGRHRGLSLVPFFAGAADTGCGCCCLSSMEGGERQSIASSTPCQDDSVAVNLLLSSTSNSTAACWRLPPVLLARAVRSNERLLGEYLRYLGTVLLNEQGREDDVAARLWHLVLVWRGTTINLAACELGAPHWPAPGLAHLDAILGHRAFDAPAGVKERLRGVVARVLAEQ